MSPRKALDRYLTRRSWDVEQLLSNVDIRGSVMELCCGEKDIVEVIEKEMILPTYQPNRGRVHTIYTNDIDHTMNPDYCLDASCPACYDRNIPCEFSEEHSIVLPIVDWHITNPPYNLAPKIIPLAFQHARVGIAMLLRLSYLEPITRSKRKDATHRGLWLAKYPPTDLLILPRYSYTGDGKTDSVTSAWMVWDKRQIPPFPIQPDGVSGSFDKGFPGEYTLYYPRYQRILCIPEPSVEKVANVLFQQQ